MAETDRLTPDTRCAVCWDRDGAEVLAEFHVDVVQPGRVTWHLVMCPAHAAYALANPRRDDVVVMFPLS